MGKVKKYEPGLVKVKPEEAFPDADMRIGGFWTSKRFPGLDALINGVPTDYAWERWDFLDRHFELIDWRKWWRSLSGPMPGLQWDTNFQDVFVYQLSQKPFTVVVVWKRKLRWGRNAIRFYYRLKWRLWWRKIDPMKDAKLRAILEGAVAMDALAGREP